MQASEKSTRSKRLAAAGVIIIVAGVALAYFETIGTPASQGSQISSLNSAVVSLNQVVSSQSSAIDSLQSQQSSGGVTSTRTVTSVSTSIDSTTVTATKTVTTGVASQSTVTVTITEVSVTVLPVGEPDGATLSGTLSVPEGNGTGTLQITVANTGNDPIVGITVSVPTGSDPTSDLCSAACTMQILQDGTAISTSNPVQVQNNAAGTLTTDQGQSGETYTISVAISYADGTTPPSQTILLTAST